MPRQIMVKIFGNIYLKFPKTKKTHNNAHFQNLLRNPTFVTTIVLGIFEAIIINGFAAFMPKILETILSVTPSIASYLSCKFWELRRFYGA